MRMKTISVYNNPEFACEMAVVAANRSDLSVLVIDLDMLNPTADLLLNVNKMPDRIRFGADILENTGLNIVMDAISKNIFSPELLMEAVVRKKAIKNLYVLTGNYNLDSYEYDSYFSRDSLIMLLNAANDLFDLSILIVNGYIYDLFTVISLLRCDMNIVPVTADCLSLKRDNRHFMFLNKSQNIPLKKHKFVAFEYDKTVNLRMSLIKELTENNFVGCIRYSRKRVLYRNTRISYAAKMEREVLNDYVKVLNELEVLPSLPLKEHVFQKSGIPAALKQMAKNISVRKRLERGKHYAASSVTSPKGGRL